MRYLGLTLMPKRVQQVGPSYVWFWPTCVSWKLRERLSWQMVVDEPRDSHGFIYRGTGLGHSSGGQTRVDMLQFQIVAELYRQLAWKHRLYSPKRSTE